jgi:hypothetical protein
VKVNSSNLSFNDAKIIIGLGGTVRRSSHNKRIYAIFKFNLSKINNLNSLNFIPLSIKDYANLKNINDDLYFGDFYAALYSNNVIGSYEFTIEDMNAFDWESSYVLKK